MHLTIWYMLCVCDQDDVCENSIASVYFGLSEADFSKLCPVSFIVVGESIVCGSL